MEKRSQIEKNIQKFDEEITNRKKLTADMKKNLNSKVFENLIYFMVIMAYLIAVNIISANIDTEIFFIIIKIVSFIWLAISILICEISYRKDNEALALHGLEILSIAIVSLFLISSYKLYYDKFALVIETIIIAYILFYAFKIIYILIKTRIKHNKNLSDINTIVRDK